MRIFLQVLIFPNLLFSFCLFDYFDKIYKVLSPLLSSGDYDDIKLNIEVKLPIAKGVSDTTKEYKDKISNTIKEIKKLVIYDNYDSIKSGILKTKDYVEEIIKMSYY